ncbi:type II toxin-antitoxin system RelE/ParE family toxin [Singulisphaera sp. Ch08]|uniref:Type II toxin-antitoxin system RelE/ParE family toxin n=1 Tax=Singulisphaera sp. Ch08 TaxID=3120278 RepID=A0AAU7CI19_9BACT
MFRVEITAKARDDADEAYAWMVENISPANAEKWYQELFEQIETLTKHPARCPVASESRKFPEEIRELIYGKQRHKHKYRILFTIRQDVVAILHVYHSARNELEP